MFKSIIAATAIALTATTAMAETPTTSLQDYSFDFATMGYEVKFNGVVNNYSEPLENGDYVWLQESGYRVKVSFDALSRNGKRQMTDYFNANCVGYSDADECDVVVTGEVQLTDEMQVMLIARDVVLDNVEYK
jgi:hypothetical protein